LNGGGAVVEDAVGCVDSEVVVTGALLSEASKRVRRTLSVASTALSRSAGKSSDVSGVLVVPELGNRVGGSAGVVGTEFVVTAGDRTVDAERAGAARSEGIDKGSGDGAATDINRVRCCSAAYTLGNCDEASIVARSLLLSP